jgi:hypothetical protein
MFTAMIMSFDPYSVIIAGIDLNIDDAGIWHNAA